MRTALKRRLSVPGASYNVHIVEAGSKIGLAEDNMR